jgi:hypothetical protein
MLVIHAFLEENVLHSPFLKVFPSRMSVIYIPDSEIKYILGKFTLNGGPYGVEWECRMLNDIGEKWALWNEVVLKLVFVLFPDSV